MKNMKNKNQQKRNNNYRKDFMGLKDFQKEQQPINFLIIFKRTLLLKVQMLILSSRNMVVASIMMTKEFQFRKIKAHQLEILRIWKKLTTWKIKCLSGLISIMISQKLKKKIIICIRLVKLEQLKYRNSNFNYKCNRIEKK